MAFADGHVRVRFAFSPNGRLYFVAEETVVNLTGWAIRWPEAAAVGFGLFAIVGAIRIAGDRRTAGEEHCRGCGYPLRGLSSNRCPECGGDLSARGRVIPRPKALRLAVPVLAGLLCAMSAAAPEAVRGAVAEAVAVRSAGVYRWEELCELLPVSWRERRLRLVELDPLTGYLRLLRDEPFRPEEDSPADLVALPDGESVTVLSSKGVIERILIRDGSVVQRVDLGEEREAPGATLAVSRDAAVLAVTANWTPTAAWRLSDNAPVDAAELRPDAFLQAEDCWLSDFDEWKRVGPLLPSRSRAVNFGRAVADGVVCGAVVGEHEPGEFLLILRPMPGVLRTGRPVIGRPAVSPDGRWAAAEIGRYEDRPRRFDGCVAPTRDLRLEIFDLRRAR